jgi:predicted nucleotidyltransferase component of viral defense system
MIAKDTIKALGTKYQTAELNVQREYMQHLFLSYFYQQPQAKEVFFKGGTALRIVYKSPRFSEDLDFGSTLHNVGEIETAVLHTLDAIEREGINTRIVSSDKTSGGYLANIDFDLDEITVRLRFEASFREHALKSEAEQVVNDFIPPYIINVLAKDQLVSGKIAALMARQKPRDFYDLYYLLQNGFISVEQKSVLRDVLPLVENTKINFTQELKVFLPASLWPIIKDFKTVLERSIRRFI